MGPLSSENVRKKALPPDLGHSPSCAGQGREPSARSCLYHARNIWVCQYIFMHIYKHMQTRTIHAYTHTCAHTYVSVPGSSVSKESACNAGDSSSISWVGKIPWRRDALPTPVFLGFPAGSAGKESACNAGDLGSIPGSRPGYDSLPWRRERLPTPVFWPGEFHGLYSPWGG